MIEASSGSTSIALALCCAQMGLKFIAVMPDSVSQERVVIIKSLGGEIALTDRVEGMAGAVRFAADEAARTGAYCPRQFENMDNAEAHRVSTGQEILNQIPGGVVTGVVSGVGTGGTIVGLYQAFQQAGCPVTPYLARPIDGQEHHYHPECHSFSSRVPGVLDCFSKLFSKESMPGLTEVGICDDTAIATTRELIRMGFPVGPSSGLNYAAAVQVAEGLGRSDRIVTVFPDRMERYFPTELFSKWT